MKKILVISCLLISCFNLFSIEKYDFIVAKDGTGNFTTVQAAIDACKSFPDKPILIFIKNGIYKEKVKVPSCNSLLIIKGESVEKTIITNDDSFNKINRGRNSTFYTYTFMVEANDVQMENITIENSSGPIGQAVALHVEGDRCIFRNCRILGNQDTLYAAGETSRQYFYDCYIEGGTDFIFGAATAVFERCTLHTLSNSCITAASTTKGIQFGYVFLNCKLTGEKGATKVHLGRPWRDFANVVFIHCQMGAHIAPAGWMNWDKTQRDKTAFFAEYDNTSVGSNTSSRVSWSKILTDKEAAEYTVTNILKGFDGWNPQK